MRAAIGYNGIFLVGYVCSGLAHTAHTKYLCSRLVHTAHTKYSGF